MSFPFKDLTQVHQQQAQPLSPSLPLQVLQPSPHTTQSSSLAQPTVSPASGQPVSSISGLSSLAQTSLPLPLHADTSSAPAEAHYPSSRPISSPTLSQPILPPILPIPSPPGDTLHTMPSSSSPHHHTALSSSPPDHMNLSSTSQLTSHTHSMTTRTRDQTRKPRQFLDYVAHHVVSESEPTSFKQALNSSNWRLAMSQELNALASNNTWTLVPAPIDQKVIGCKWVFKLKRKPDGSVDRYKARLVAKGYNQEAGIDYMETYSPVIRATTIRIILSFAVSSRWPIRQLDISNAFLNGDLSEIVYMNQPQGFTDPTHPDYVCLLHKSLYGLKQAPRAWFQKLSDSLVRLGFKPSCYDPSLFLSHSNNHTTLILVYVDDIIVTGTDSTYIDHCISHLSSSFTVRDLGSLH